MTKAIERNPLARKERPPKESAEFYWHSAGEMITDPELQAAFFATERTVVNAAISAADTIPVAGDLVSLAADGVKALHRAELIFIYYSKIVEGWADRLESLLPDPDSEKKPSVLGAQADKGIEAVADGARWTIKKVRRVQERLKQLFELAKKIDPSKDVGLMIAIGSEAAELALPGFVPTHLTETLLQFKKDVPVLKRGFIRLIERIRAMCRREYLDYEQHPEVAEAIEVFAEESTEPDIAESTP